MRIIAKSTKIFILMTLCIGMSGDYVRSVQRLLAGLSLYPGPIDSSYGGGTYAAVKTFQLRNHLPPTGLVDAPTWELMFPGQPEPVSDLSSESLSDRCLALTGSFETSTYPPDSFCGLSGDFDHMGLSFGVCQWNIGQGTLQPLLEQMFQQHPAVAQDIFHEDLETLASLQKAGLPEQLAFARSIQNKGQIIEPWRGMFLSLGRTPEFRAIQASAASASFKLALELCARYGLTSERAAALMFDILTQNGSIDTSVSRAILKAVARLPASAENEVARLVIIANHVADSAAPEHMIDVRNRKLAIAQGAGIVHGLHYDLAEVFGIRLSPFPPR